MKGGKGGKSALFTFECFVVLSGVSSPPQLDPREVNTERSYYEEQVLTPDKKHEATDILVSEKAQPNESV